MVEPEEIGVGAGPSADAQLLPGHARERIAVDAEGLGQVERGLSSSRRSPDALIPEHESDATRPPGVRTTQLQAELASPKLVDPIRFQTRHFPRNEPLAPGFD